MHDPSGITAKPFNSALLLTPVSNRNAKVYLVCFAYAGGSSTMYLPWLKHLHPDAELVVCQLPGRGTRLGEQPYEQMEPLIRDLCAAIRPFGEKPMVFFGHSLGSKLAYELCLAMQQQQLPLPIHFIASAAAAPFHRRNKIPIHDLPEAEFIQALAKLKGTPTRVLSNPELMALYLPALRADFKLAETYCNTARKVIDTGLTLMGGTRDELVTEAELTDWQCLFSRASGIHWFEGDHFFIHYGSPAVLHEINHLIAASCLAISSLVTGQARSPNRSN